MDGPTGSQSSRRFAEWRLLGILFLVHAAIAAVMWAVAGLLIVGDQLVFPRDFLFLGVALGQLTLAAVWAAYGTPRLIFRGLFALLLVLVGAHLSVAAFCASSGKAAHEYLPVVLMGGQWFLFTTAVLVSIRWLWGRRLIYVSQPQSDGKERSQFSLRQLLGLSAVWALPLAAPGLLSTQAGVAGATILSCAILCALAMFVAAPLTGAALARERMRRKMAWAVLAVLALSTVESLVFLISMWSDMEGLAIAQTTLCLWAIGSVLAFNGTIAAVVLPTMLMMRAAGYRFAQRRRAVEAPAIVAIPSNVSDLTARSAA